MKYLLIFSIYVLSGCSLSERPAFNQNQLTAIQKACAENNGIVNLESTTTQYNVVSISCRALPASTEQFTK